MQLTVLCARLTWQHRMRALFLAAEEVPTQAKSQTGVTGELRRAPVPVTLITGARQCGGLTGSSQLGR